jgi:UDP-N-acetylglucosamine--N-acetylmuramyl-(pentapeptide) pyrophosphoryl-undecaprenol N-acetylglucosamine transferase
MSAIRKKIVIAAGGTGGHLFPAQALAHELSQSGIDILFMGAGLEKNRYFDREKFSYRDIPSATVFRRNPLQLFPSLIQLSRGIKQSYKLLSEENPDLIMGFGSFHSFPILCAARLQKKRIALFESNAYPGKVNRLFARTADYTAVVFSQAQHHLKGTSIEVAMPVRHMPADLSAEEAREYFGLAPRATTLLIFGGSQGAQAMNELFATSITKLKAHTPPFQVIHITGNGQTVEPIQKAYASWNIRACVKSFETEMPRAYRAASFAVCRAGAATISELIAFEVPSILIPFPYAADDHQAKNAEFVQNTVKGGIHLPEKGLSPDTLAEKLLTFLDPGLITHTRMKESIVSYKSRHHKKHLCTLINEMLHTP